MAHRLSMRSFLVVAACLSVLTAASGTVGSDRAGRQLDRTFAEVVHSFLETYCFACHGPEKQKGKLDLRVYPTRQSVAADYRRWEVLLQKLQEGEMPPDEAKLHPTTDQRERVIEWIKAVRRQEAERNAGDPGPVMVRRLSNAEYDYTIHDLTGVDVRPAKEFPVDPANEAGFDNSGESLAMSPALLRKYLEAARRVAEHVVLKPEGFIFAPHPVITETDRDKYAVKRIIDFYQRQRTDYADFFLAAWRFKHRGALGKPNATLGQIAAEDRLSANYLALIWTAVSGSGEETGPMATVQRMWRELPSPQAGQPESARAGCERIRDYLVSVRQKLKPQVENLSVRGIAAGSQPLVLWKDRELAANHRRYDARTLQTEGATNAPADRKPSAPSDPELVLPPEPAQRARYEAGLERFCRLFPDAFYVPERVLIFLKEDKDSRGRLLSAGFHLMTGYFRDDSPLADLILDEAQRRELDRLWEEFHFITLDSIRQYKDFIFFERAEPPRFMQGAQFDFARSEDKDAASEPKIRQLAEVYLAKARSNGGSGEAIQAIEDYFKNISTAIRQIERARLAAEPSHLQALQVFAERAFRRPLAEAERADLLAFYRELREREGLDHEEAIRDAVVSVLMSPSFCYRLNSGGEFSGRVPPLSGGPVRAGGRRSTAAQINSAEGQVGGGGTPPSRRAGPRLVDSNAPKWKAEPLTDYALASRLSYFLWSSAPDAALLGQAKAGSLHRPRVLLAETQRMLQDGRIRRLATEFGGNWLDFRRFEEHNSVDRERFTSFDNALREAMFQEPIEFFVDVVRADRSILEFLEADHTFVNPVLARHYGISLHFKSNEWVRVDQAGRFGRGGLLPMAVFLTKNAPGLRTSPVKRGYWVVRRLLGEQIPPPPPKVPELPSDEAKLGDLTLREVLARHREDKSCAACHARFDGVGLVFEGYGPIGEQRVTDLGGRPVDTHATFPGGTEGQGMDGLRRYLRERREEEFLDNFCRKLLAYALGRTLMLSDDGTIQRMRAKLAANGSRFSGLVEEIVASPQFLTRRVYQESRTP